MNMPSWVTSWSGSGSRFLARPRSMILSWGCPAGTGDHQVVRRDVPVDHAGAVDRVEPPQRLDRQVDRDVARERPVPAHAGAHVLPLDVLPDHVEAAVAQAGVVVQDGDVGVLDLGREAGLAQEALLGVRVADPVGAQDLDHPLLFQVDVAHQVDLAHAAPAQVVEDFVLAVENAAGLLLGWGQVRLLPGRGCRPRVAAPAPGNRIVAGCDGFLWAKCRGGPVRDSLPRRI